VVVVWRAVTNRPYAGWGCHNTDGCIAVMVVWRAVKNRPYAGWNCRKIDDCVSALKQAYIKKSNLGDHPVWGWLIF